MWVLGFLRRDGGVSSIQKIVFAEDVVLLGGMSIRAKDAKIVRVNHKNCCVE